MKADQSLVSSAECLLNSTEITEEQILSMMSEFLDQNYKNWVELQAKWRKLSRDLRSSDFRAYYEAITSEDSRLGKIQQESLEGYLSVKGISNETYSKALSRVDQSKFEKFVIEKMLSARMIHSFSEQVTISKYQLSEYMRVKQTLIDQAKLSPGWQDYQTQKVLCRIVEDKCYDEFGIDDPTATHLGYLLKIEGRT